MAGRIQVAGSRGIFGLIFMGIVGKKPLRAGATLPAVISAEPAELSPHARAELRALAGRAPAVYLATVAVTWLTIFGAIGLAEMTGHWAATLLAIIVIGTRQFTLGFLLHEEVHRRGLPQPWGELVGNLTTAYPLGLTVRTYGHVHLAHHKHFFTQKDPDWVRKQGSEWTFPLPRWTFWRVFFRDLAGLNLPKLIRSKSAAAEDGSEPSRIHGWVRPGYYLVVALALTASETWSLFFLYWLLPFATVLQGMVRFGAITEHKYDLISPRVAEATPMVRFQWWERLVQPTLGFFTFHTIHHHHPGIPWSRLPKAHRVYIREGLVNEKNIFPSALSFLASLVRSTPAVSRAHGLPETGDGRP